MKAFLCELLFSCLIAAPAAKPIDELTYGTALYAYHQEDYRQALLELLVAEQRGWRGDAVRFELAKGSFAFKERLYDFAAETFAAVDTGQLSDLDRLRLSFHLAREHHRRGDWNALRAELALLETAPDSRAHPEVAFMIADAALARGDFAAAGGALDALRGDRSWLAYGLFNLGVAQRAAGDVAAARRAFERLAALEPHDRESADLIARGRLALAAMHRDSGHLPDASAMLAALPAEGRYRDLALASYGRLAMQQNDHRLAARIWLTLTQSGHWSASHASAHLGLPMSLERLPAPAHALDGYRRAEGAFQARLGVLQEASLRARDPAWVLSLLAAAGEGSGLGSRSGDRSHERDRSYEGIGLGGDAWHQWLAGEDVHQLMVEWRELDDMSRWLERLPTRIEAFSEVAAERRRRSEAARTMLEQQALRAQRDAVAERVAALEADLERLAREPARPDRAWMIWFARGPEQSLIDALERLAERAARHPDDRRRSALEARIARLRGIVFWQLAEQRSTRLRELDKQIHENRALLVDIDARQQRLAQAEAAFAAGVEADFVLLAGRADDVARRVADARLRREHRLAEALRQGLEREMTQTRQMLLTAQIAIARATDQLASGADARQSSGGGQ